MSGVVFGRGDPNGPDRAQRQLAREIISAAVFRADDMDGYSPSRALDEAVHLTSKPKELISFLSELWVWSQVAIQMAADAQDVSVEVVVAQITGALDGPGSRA